MKRRAMLCAAMLGMLLLGGCLGDTRGREGRDAAERNETETAEMQKTQRSAGEPKALEEQKEADAPPKPEIIEADWSGYFDGLSGAAVLYDASSQRYAVFHRDLALTRRPPCSTFKIASSLIALERGILDPEHSTRAWSGELFWNEAWNRDIDFAGAFCESCVWYFRELADEIGQEMMQEELNRLQYGNCDISDWEGRLNTNNGNRALTGFWLESSLLISPKEQTEVMERIFGEDSVYSKETQEELKQVMAVSGRDVDDVPVYGKTGMGKADGAVVDAWFAGFAEKEGKNLYFCVYLGRTDGKDVTSAAAKEIAIRLVEDY